MKSEIALELNDTGIISKVRNINITWDKITDVRYFTGRYSNFVAIDLLDKKAFKSRVRNPFKLFLMWSNELSYSTPLILPTVAIKGKDREIFETIKNYLDDFKSRNET